MKLRITILIALLAVAAILFVRPRESAPPPVAVDTVHHLHGIVRPDPSGNWFVQNDVDHAAHRIVAVRQTDKYLDVDFDSGFTHAGVAHISPDDDLTGYITAGASLGLSGMRIVIKRDGKVIDPASIYQHPGAPVKGSGNLWITVRMVNRTLPPESK